MPTAEHDSTNSAPIPGWREVLIGGAVYVFAIAATLVLLPMIESAAIAGTIALFVSGAMGLIAFAAAYLVRRPPLTAFGFRRTRPRDLLIGLALGVVAYILGIIVSLGYFALAGEIDNVQSSYQAAAALSPLSLILALVGGSIVTPLGEEAFFRGIVANTFLQRMRPWLAIVLSAAIFAVAHGINPVLPIAFIVGIFTGLLFHKTRSIWPGVVAHATNNTAALVIPLALGGLGG